ncbi:LOW QUALITY PROTEIN: hypothetical protein AAY473_023778 [Plecturocebus cupreus]
MTKFKKKIYAQSYLFMKSFFFAYFELLPRSAPTPVFFVLIKATIISFNVIYSPYLEGFFPFREKGKSVSRRNCRILDYFLNTSESKPTSLMCGQLSSAIIFIGQHHLIWETFYFIFSFFKLKQFLKNRDGGLTMLPRLFSNWWAQVILLPWPPKRFSGRARSERDQLAPVRARERTIGLAGVEGCRHGSRSDLGFLLLLPPPPASRPLRLTRFAAETLEARHRRALPLRRVGGSGRFESFPGRAAGAEAQRWGGGGGGPTPPQPREEGQRGGSPRVGTPAAGAAGQSAGPWCPGGVGTRAEAGPRAARLRGTCARDASTRRSRVSAPAGAVRLAPRKCLLAPRGWEEGRERQRGRAGGLCSRAALKLLSDAQ